MKKMLIIAGIVIVGLVGVWFWNTQSNTPVLENDMTKTKQVFQRVRNAETQTTVDYYIVGRVASYGEEFPQGVGIDLVFDEDTLKRRLPIVLLSSGEQYKVENALVAKNTLLSKVPSGSLVELKLSFLTSQLTKEDRALMAMLRNFRVDIDEITSLSGVPLLVGSVRLITN